MSTRISLTNNGGANPRATLSIKSRDGTVTKVGPDRDTVLWLEPGDTLTIESDEAVPKDAAPAGDEAGRQE